MTLSTGDKLDNRYQIKEFIGAGAFGAVYRAADRLSDLAIKELNRHSMVLFGSPGEIQQRFEQEAQIARRLAHPHIIEVYSFFPANDTWYIVMPYLPQTLEHQLGSLTLSQAITFMTQVCEGLAYAHQAGVVHCDIKPSNVLLDQNNRVKITDFGIAHVPRQGNLAQTLSDGGFGAGTPFYMAPEQLEGRRDSPHIDVYGLGALFYRMLTGQYYLDFETTDTTKARAKNILLINEVAPREEPLRQKQIPEPLIQLIFKALAKEPEHRFAHAGAMLAALQNYQSDLDWGTVPVPIFEPIKTRPDTTEEIIPPTILLTPKSLHLVVLEYEIKKSGWPFKQTFTLHLQVKRGVDLPALLLVRQKNRLPRNKNDGEIIKRLEGGTINTTDLMVSLPETAGQPHCFARLFLEDEKLSPWVKLRTPQEEGKLALS